MATQTLSRSTAPAATFGRTPLSDLRSERRYHQRMALSVSDPAARASHSAQAAELQAQIDARTSTRRPVAV